jgi:hypothetical protein
VAITTLDGVIAGFRPPETIIKVTGTMEAAGVGAQLRYSGGRPGASAAPSPGINGQAVTAATYAGEIPRVNPGSGNAYLGRLALTSSVVGTLLLIDRLWDNSGLSVTSTSAQAISPATIPARDRDGSTNGVDVMAAVEWSAAGGAGTPNVNLTYTDQDGNTGAVTPNLVGNATPATGCFEIFQLAAGDTGIRAPTSFIQSATRTSGTMHLVLFRLLAQLEITTANIGNAIDAITSGMPRIYNDSCLELVMIPNATTSGTVFGQYVETQG